METCDKDHPEIVHSSDILCPLCEELEKHYITQEKFDEVVETSNKLMNEFQEQYPEFLI